MPVVEKLTSTVAISATNPRELQITPEKLENNSSYTITIKGIIDASTGKTLPDKTIVIKTPYYPMYCTLESLKVVVDTFEIPEQNLLSFIRDASKYADFVSGGEADSTDFAVEEFVRTKAVLDCLVRTFMNRSVEGGNKYKLDTVEYEDSTNSAAFKNLIDALKKALQKWQDAVRGYYNEGRVKPKATRIGIKSSQNGDVSYTTIDNILQDFSRTMPQWS